MFIRSMYLAYNLLWKINIERQTRLYLVRGHYNNSYSRLYIGSSKKKLFYHEIALFSPGTRKIIFLSLLFPGGLPPTDYYSISTWNGHCLSQGKTVFYPCTISCWIVHFLNPKYFLFLAKSSFP